MIINKKIKNVAVVSSDEKMKSALNHIMCAIDDLGSAMKEDPSCKEDIANLSVVLFDMKSRKNI